MGIVRDDPKLKKALQQVAGVTITTGVCAGIGFFVGRPWGGAALGAALSGGAVHVTGAPKKSPLQLLHDMTDVQKDNLKDAVVKVAIQRGISFLKNTADWDRLASEIQKDLLVAALKELVVASATVYSSLMGIVRDDPKLKKALQQVAGVTITTGVCAGIGFFVGGSWGTCVGVALGAALSRGAVYVTGAPKKSPLQFLLDMTDVQKDNLNDAVVKVATQRGISFLKNTVDWGSLLASEIQKDLLVATLK